MYEPKEGLAWGEGMDEGEFDGSKRNLQGPRVCLTATTCLEPHSTTRPVDVEAMTRHSPAPTLTTTMTTASQSPEYKHRYSDYSSESDFAERRPLSTRQLQHSGESYVYLHTCSIDFTQVLIHLTSPERPGTTE